jgi:glucose-6-phosphate isomerase
VTAKNELILVFFMERNQRRPLVNIDIVNPCVPFSNAITQIANEDIVSRIWADDHTVWDSSPEEIANRLGWLQLPYSMGSQIPRINQFVDSVRAEGFTHAVVLGMGGSSLAPDTLSHVFGTRDVYLQLQILDSTHPEAVSQVTQDHAHRKTLFIVATKSGTTSETLSLFRFFYQFLAEQIDKEAVGSRFIAITDPGTPLVEIASTHEFRDVFTNDPNLGGRYSALSLFGLIPAALLGLDLDVLLHEAQSMAVQCAPSGAASDNPAVLLGALLATCALQGRDKATLLLSRKIAPLGGWIEQLLAESTGKAGSGIVPVVEPVSGESESYGQDRAFVVISLGKDPEMDAVADNLTEQNHSVARIRIETVSEIAGQFFLWEFATAIACHILGVHPFNQPNVESAKQLARDMIGQSHKSGTSPLLAREPLSAGSIVEFLSSVSPGDYVSIHAYLPPTQALTRELQSLKRTIQTRYGVAVTIGYGPRFLHSTGQLHKGDRGNGHFIQLVSETMPDLAIPDVAGGSDSSLSFGALITAQAFGDRRALESEGRPVLTLEIAVPVSQIIQNIAASLIS